MAEKASAPVAAPAGNRGFQPDSEGTTILLLGALGIPLVVTAPIAWYLGSQYVKRCKREGRQPDSAAETGRILGMVMTILWVSLIALYLLFMVLMALMMAVFYVLFFVIMIVIMLAAAVAGAPAGV